MVVSKFRFLETTGIGGESNPCIEPIFDQTLEAPTRLVVHDSGHITATDNLHLPSPAPKDRNATIGALPDNTTRNTMIGLFEEEDDEEDEDEN